MTWEEYHDLVAPWTLELNGRKFRPGPHITDFINRDEVEYHPETLAGRRIPAEEAFAWMIEKYNQKITETLALLTPEQVLAKKAELRRDYADAIPVED